MSVYLEPLQEVHFERLHNLFDAVCRERRFMAFTQAGPKEQAFAYYRSILAAGHTHLVAVRGDALVGWCDVLPQLGQMRTHAGTLGMAIAAQERSGRRQAVDLGDNCQRCTKGPAANRANRLFREPCRSSSLQERRVRVRRNTTPRLVPRRCLLRCSSHGADQ